jgi:hypothetical protein
MQLSFQASFQSSITYRKTCSRVYRVYLGPQVLSVFLVGHESVRSPPRSFSGLNLTNTLHLGNQFSPTKSKPSKPLLRSTRSCRKAIPSFSRRHSRTQIGWRACGEATIVAMACEVAKLRKQSCAARTNGCQAMANLLRSTSTFSEQSLPSTGSTRNSMVFLFWVTIRATSNKYRHLRVRGVYQLEIYQRSQ